MLLFTMSYAISRFLHGEYTTLLVDVATRDFLGATNPHIATNCRPFASDNTLYVSGVMCILLCSTIR